MPMKELSFYSDGNTLKGWHYYPDDTKRHPGLVLCHGFLSSHVEFGTYPERLAKHGYSVLTFDLSGHGASEGERGVTTPTSGLTDVRTAFNVLRTQPSTDPKRVGIIGHSMGAIISICTLACEERFKCGIALAPPDYLLEETELVHRLLFGFIYQLSWGQRLLGMNPTLPNDNMYEALIEDRECREHGRALGFLQENVPIKNYPAALMLRASDCARAVTQPVMVLVADHDRLVNNEHSWRVYEALGGEKEHVVIHGSGHSIMMDRSADVAFKHVLRWLKRYL